MQRLYESLCKQTFMGFEWVIVDDGSVDETRSLIQILSNREGTFFPIRYFYQENGGKHRAINRGVKEAKGELVLILDSDDSLPPTAIETVLKYFEPIKGDKRFGGVAGYMAHHDGTVIGQSAVQGVVDCSSLDYRYRYHASGDMCEVFRTEVLREFPFPEIKGERFVPEALVWNRIAQKYQLRWFRDVIYYRDYLEGGLTDKIVKIRMKSPIATTTCYQELCGYEIPFNEKVKAAINYWRFRFCSREWKTLPLLSWYWIWTMPLGWVMHLKDLKKVKG